jgi:hypothetical protein
MHTWWVYVWVEWALETAIATWMFYKGIKPSPLVSGQSSGKELHTGALS